MIALLSDMSMKLIAFPVFSRFSGQPAVRSGAFFAWGGTLTLVAWVAVDLFWRINMPPSPDLAVTHPADPQQAAQAIVSRHLM
ncbi:MAG TPA: hypothetical protein PLX65_07900, partial [Accumulibacter sp.]|nr:hypothetical protein [Accumulibacter sp.]